MKTVTNYYPGARGVNMKNGTTVFVDPGQTVDIDESQVNGDMPDFGTKPSDDPAADAAAAAEAMAALQSENEALKVQVTDLTSQLAAATAPKK